MGRNHSDVLLDPLFGDTLNLLEVPFALLEVLCRKLLSLVE
jgi:hypothetical protein